jgi:hypothetical protein
LLKTRFTFFSREFDGSNQCLYYIKPFSGETMADNVNIPDDILETFKRLTSQVPEKLRSDSHTQNVIQLYLKLGGEKLARQYIDILKLNIIEEERQNMEESENPEDSDTDDEYSDFDS